jgi:cob(I)alamin adenosyltransferase
MIGLLIALLSDDTGPAPAPHTTPAADAPARARLLEVQHDLFDLGAELSVPGLMRLQEQHIGQLEQSIEQLNAVLPPLKEFVLPGGSIAASVCHLARTACRRAERRGWQLAQRDGPDEAPASAHPPSQAINPVSLRYLNRLSDLLFVLARTLARAGGGAEILWRNREPASS